VRSLPQKIQVSYLVYLEKAIYGVIGQLGQYFSRTQLTCKRKENEK
jgi:hypothetical protein